MTYPHLAAMSRDCLGPAVLAAAQPKMELGQVRSKWKVQMAFGDVTALLNIWKFALQEWNLQKSS